VQPAKNKVSRRCHTICQPAAIWKA